MNKVPKKSLIIVAIVAIIMVSSIITTFAVWSTLPEASVMFEMGVVNENPSLKYQLFVPVNADNVRIAGNYDFSSKVYTLDNALDSENIVGLALVGFEGGVVIDRLQVPDTFLYNINNEESTYAVKSIIIDTEYRPYYLRNNTLFYTVIIPQNVEYIADGAFMALENLTNLIYMGSGEILVGDFAFADCRKLTVPKTPEGRVVVNR